MHLDLPPPTIVENARGISRPDRRLEQQREIAVDTRPIRFFSYHERSLDRRSPSSKETRDYLRRPLSEIDTIDPLRPLCSPIREAESLATTESTTSDMKPLRLRVAATCSTRSSLRRHWFEDPAGRPCCCDHFRSSSSLLCSVRTGHDRLGEAIRSRASRRRTTSCHCFASKGASSRAPRDIECLECRRPRAYPPPDADFVATSGEGQGAPHAGRARTTDLRELFRAAREDRQRRRSASVSAWMNTVPLSALAIARPPTRFSFAVDGLLVEARLALRSATR